MVGSAVEILLVEDNGDHVELTLRALNKIDVERKKVHVARDGAEALEYLFRAGVRGHQPPHYHLGLILLDPRSPKVSGLEVLARIKADERTRHIPVVVLTSSPREEDRREAYRLGANSYVVKPLTFDRLTEVLAQIVRYWLLLNERIF